MKSPVRKAASSFPSRTAFPIWTGMIPSWSCTRAAWLTTVRQKPCCITSAFRWRRFAPGAQDREGPFPEPDPSKHRDSYYSRLETGKGKENSFRELPDPDAVRLAEAEKEGASGESGTEREKAVEENIPEVPDATQLFWLPGASALAHLFATVPSWFLQLNGAVSCAGSHKLWTRAPGKS